MVCILIISAHEINSGSERQIMKHFEEVYGEIQKVMNFTVSKFKESPGRLFMVAPGFEKDVQDLIKAHFGISVAVLKITTWNVSSQWYAAIGAALRTSEIGADEFLINLASEDGTFSIVSRRLISFDSGVVLWFGVFSIFLILFAGSSYSLAREFESARNNLAILVLTHHSVSCRNYKARFRRSMGLCQTFVR